MAVGSRQQPARGEPSLALLRAFHTGLASALRKSADTITYIQRQGVRLRLEDEEFRTRFEELDRTLIEETCSDQ